MKKNGFTLVELLAVIVLLALISAVTVPIISNSLSNYRAKICETQLDQIIASAKLWADDHILLLPDNDGETYTITLKTLSDGGYLDNDVTNPQTKKKYDKELTTVTIKKTGKKFTYTLDEDTANSCQ